VNHSGRAGPATVNSANLGAETTRADARASQEGRRNAKLSLVDRATAPPMRRATTVPGAVEAIFDPALILIWLLTMSKSLEQLSDARVLVAGVLVFALTFPGNVALTDSFGALVRKSIVTALTVLAALALVDYASAWLRNTPRHLFLPWFVALPLFLIGGNLLARMVLRRLMARSDVQETVIICGVNEIGLGLAQRLRANPYFGVRVVGFFDDRQGDRLATIGDLTYLGTFEQLSNYVRQHGVARIYLALPMTTQPRILSILEELKDTTASIYFAPDIFVTDLMNGRIGSVGGMPVVTVRDTPFMGLNGLFKRIEDLALSIVALTVFAPIFLAIALAVRLDSPGPIVFRQRRYGLDGRLIVIYKFRTMTVVEDGAAQFTAACRDDQRVTRVGRLLRRFSLDELPQVLNVLQGQMSMVGPRPHAVAMNEKFRKLIPGYMLRHKVKPGITGLAQVRGYRGGDDVDAMHLRIASDLEYLRYWTPAMDLQILVRTIPVMLGDKRAY
jgi:putative colanic acid biosynthesis UDP-glucose lipid carrier transferase